MIEKEIAGSLLSQVIDLSMIQFSVKRLLLGKFS